MNKYARTKDNKIVKVDVENGIYTSKYELVGEPKNTIEELCDEFVLDHSLFGPNCKTLYHNFKKAKNGIKKRDDGAHNLCDFNIYGAIWTNKGLLYVAKMNNEGKLELLNENN